MTFAQLTGPLAISAWLRPALLIGALSLVAPACSGGETGEGETDISSTNDAGGPDDTGIVETDTGTVENDTGGTTDEEDTGAADTADAGGTEEDAGPADAGPVDNCPGGDYCECNANDECDSSYCIPDGAGKQCAQTCVDSCKKDGYVCVPTAGQGGDTVNLCVLEGGAICNPCEKNQDCTTLAYPNAACVDNGNAGAFCGQGCKTDDGCAVGYTCADVKDVTGAEIKQCVPKDNALCACSAAAITLKLQTKCFDTTGTAKCEGVRKCLPDGEQGAPPGGGLSACLVDSAGEEKCDGKDNDCDGDVDEEACDDDNECTADSCDAANAACKHVNQDGPCDADDSKCTKDDVCSNGVCKAGESLKCDDNNDCTADSCDPKAGCVNTAKGGDTCNADDNECTQNDSCTKDGTCTPGQPKACADDNPCVTGSCNVTKGGKCDYTSQEGTLCNDGNSCTIKDKCKGVVCGGVPNTCDDGNSCTDDSCDKAKGCLHTALAGPCDDGDLCTVSDNCVDDKCVGKGAKDCDDGKACTDDGCDKGKGCINKPGSNKPCDDDNGCTQNDSCKDGACESGTNKCTCVTDTDCALQEDGNLCNGTLFCDKSTQVFECKVDPKTVTVCDTSKDGECAKTSCLPKTGKCQTEKTNFNGKACNDNSLCTKGDACKDGACVADKVVCDDGNVCTDDDCDPKTGCTKKANVADCDADKDACTVGDKCNGGVCDKGAAKSCDDKNQCTKDSCDAATGACKHENLTSKCDDDNPCTEGDACGTKAGKWACVSGKGPDCDDKNPCTKDTCDPTNNGCKSTIDETIKVPCYTADPKTQDVGLCVGGHRTCDKEGKASATCTGEVTPSAKEACEGKDDDCDGTTDEGCKPTGYTARFGSAVVEGKGTKYGARVFLGGSNVAGESKGTKSTVRLGFYEWLASKLSGK